MDDSLNSFDNTDSLSNDEPSLPTDSSDDALKYFIKLHACYIAERSDTNLINIQRQLDVILECPPSVSDVYHDSRYMLMADAISSLITLLNDPDIKSTIAIKVLSIFQKWIINPSLHWLLRTRFRLTSTLSAILIHFSDLDSNESIILKALNMLKLLTYDAKIGHTEVHVDGLLKFLLARVVKESSSDLSLLCMVVLANITRQSKRIQKSIRGMDGSRHFYRSIVNKINTSSNHLLTMAALSTFTSVAIDEEIGTKFFHSKDIIRTMHLVLHNIANDDLEVQRLAIDIFLELLSKEKIQRILLQYERFTDCLVNIVRLLSINSNIQTVCKVYELLCFIGGQTLLKQSTVRALHEVESTGIGDLPVIIALHWLHNPPQKLWNPSVWAAKFLICMFKTCDVSTNSSVRHHLDDILPAVADTFVLCYKINDVEFDVHLEKMIACLKLLLLVCHDKNYASKVVQSIGSDVFLEMIDFLIGHFSRHDYTSQGSNDFKSVDCQQIGQIVDAILHLLLIMIDAKSSTNDIQERLYLHLQDPKLMSIFAYALISSNAQERIVQAFQLIFLGSKLSDFPVMRLAQALSEINRSHNGNWPQQSFDKDQNPDKKYKTGISILEVPHFQDAPNTECITSLLERFKNDIDIKDVKSSEIMDMYEHKILSLEMKEKHLQGLLDAKAIALQHADRLLIEYRSRWARSDAEALQLRGILKDSERRSEMAKEGVTKAHLEIQQRQRDLVSLTEINVEIEQKNEDLKNMCAGLQNKIQDLTRTLKGKAEEINDLTRTLKGKSEEINDLSRSLKGKAEEIDDLSQANSMMKRSRDNFEEKMRGLQTMVTKLETEKQSITSVIKERDSLIKDLKKCAMELEYKNEVSAQTIVKLSKEKDTLQADIDGLKQQLNDKENDLLQLEADLEKCKAELEKLRQFTALIRNMAGNITMDATDVTLPRGN